MTRQHEGQLSHTMEYVNARGDMAHIETRIIFSYRFGTSRTHPGGHWNKEIGTFDPPDDDEAEYLYAEREVSPGKWQRIADDEWLGEWCRAAYDATDALSDHLYSEDA